MAIRVTLMNVFGRKAAKLRDVRWALSIYLHSLSVSMLFFPLWVEVPVHCTSQSGASRKGYGLEWVTREDVERVKIAG